MPSSLDELEGERDFVPAKSFDRAPTPDDVWVFAWSGAGGYGDPVERDPEHGPRGRGGGARVQPTGRRVPTAS